jgi:hypothetical protein
MDRGRTEMFPIDVFPDTLKKPDSRTTNPGEPCHNPGGTNVGAAIYTPNTIPRRHSQEHE